METAAHIEVKYTETKKVDDYSKYALGSYEYIGSLVSDGSGIYIHSDKDHAKGAMGGRSVIIIDSLGSKMWIGTVRFFTWKCIDNETLYITIILKLQVVLVITLSFK